MWIKVTVLFCLLYPVYNLCSHITVKVAHSSGIETLDPINYRDRDTQIIQKHIYESLTVRDNNLNITPGLAQRWEEGDEYWDFFLKEGVLFHDGTLFTAKDVKRTFDMVLNGSKRADLFKNISRVEVISEFIVRFYISSRWPELPLLLTLQDIGLLQSNGTYSGTGPFRLKTWEKDKITLIKNKLYHGNSSSVDELVIHFIENNLDRVMMLKKGDVDIINSVDSSSIPLLRDLEHIDIINKPSTKVIFAEFNMNMEPFNSRLVRVALNHAVDFNFLIRAIFGGAAERVTTVMLSRSPWFNNSLPPYNYDVDKARELLGNTFSRYGIVDVVTDPHLSGVASIVVSSLLKMGIRCNLLELNIDEVAERISSSNFHIYITSWGNTTLDPVGIIYPKFSKNGIANYSGYHNTELDNLLFAAQKSSTLLERKNIFNNIQKILYVDAPLIFGVAGTESFALNNRVSYFDPGITGFYTYAGVKIDD